MSTVIDQNPRSRAQSLNSLAGSAAANDDHLPTHLATMGLAHARETSDSTGGWDSYDVWRRLIKDARDRREATGNLRP